MNKLFIGLSLAAVATMVSCTSDLTESNNSTESTNSKHSVIAHLQDFKEEGSTTRTAISTDASDHISYKWAEGDVLGIFPDEGTQTEFKLSSGSLSDDGKYATFDGGAWALKSGHSYYSYFPFSYDCFSKTVNKTNIPIDYTGQKQTAFNDATNAGQYDFNAAGATSSTTGNLSFNFQRLGALLRIKLTIPATATYTSLTLTAANEVIPVKGTVDLTASTLAYAPVEYASSLVVDLNNASGTVGETAYIYVMLPPMTLKTQGETLTATLSYGDSKSTTYNLCTAGTTTVNTPDFKADYIYKRDAVYASGDTPEEAHEYVEIGGVKWATMNLGATTVAGGPTTCYGDYYAWGETEPRYTSMTITDAETATFGVWKDSYSNGYSYPYTSYSGNTLDATHDAATQNWGSDWRTPTRADFQSLANACTGSTATQSPSELTSSTPAGGIYWLSSDQTYLSEYAGVAGILFVDKMDTSKRVFFPAAGRCWGTSFNTGGSYGFYWSSSYYTSSISAYYLGFRSSTVYPSDNCYGYSGSSVRPVCK